jgi:hypothetical protein
MVPDPARAPPDASISALNPEDRENPNAEPIIPNTTGAIMRARWFAGDAQTSASPERPSSELLKVIMSRNRLAAAHPDSE